jgi:hypothetical protein
MSLTAKWRMDANGPAFVEFPKIPRLRRNITITEKIDGTNGAIGFMPVNTLEYAVGWVDDGRNPTVKIDDDYYVVYAQSRTRIITPKDDNFGFAAWVYDNAGTLAATLGPGLHYGEWWGSGIQRGYGLSEKRFSLFNTKRWATTEFTTPRLGTVPVLYQGLFGPFSVQNALLDLEADGSYASPGFMKPEGVCVYHSAANMSFKVTLEKDEAPKTKR